MSLNDVMLTVIGFTLIGWGVAWLVAVARDLRRRWR